MAIELWSNNGKSTLATGINNSVTTLDVASGHGARFPNPTGGDYFYATLDDGVNVEIVKVTARSTDTFSTIVRAQQGTSAQAFSAGAKVENRLTKQGLTDVQLPSRVLLPNHTVPVDGDYSWDNQGGASVTTNNIGIHLAMPASATASFRSRYKTAPSPPYVITAALLPNFLGTNTYDTYGLSWSDGTKFATFGVGFSTGFTGGYYLLSGKWNTSTSYSANYAAVSFRAALLWLRIADNNTNRICSFSADGESWVVFDTQTRTDFLTPTRVGFGASAQNNTYTSGLTLLSWKES